MTITAYLAGPDVFLPEAREHAQRKGRAVCARHGLVGRASARRKKTRVQDRGSSHAEGDAPP
jgi:nucleoside 2-deoxyribosyltransferase